MLPEVALPPDNIAGEPKSVPSILNCTAPVALDGVTVAVNVTDWPKTDGLAEEVIDVVVEAGLTTCDRAGDVLPKKLESPPYTAVML